MINPDVFLNYDLNLNLLSHPHWHEPFAPVTDLVSLVQREAPRFLTKLRDCRGRISKFKDPETFRDMDPAMESGSDEIFSLDWNVWRSDWRETWSCRMVKEYSPCSWVSLFEQSWNLRRFFVWEDPRCPNFKGQILKDFFSKALHFCCWLDEGHSGWENSQFCRKSSRKNRHGIKTCDFWFSAENFRGSEGNEILSSNYVEVGIQLPKALGVRNVPSNHSVGWLVGWLVGWVGWSWWRSPVLPTSWNILWRTMAHSPESQKNLRRRHLGPTKVVFLFFFFSDESKTCWKLHLLLQLGKGDPCLSEVYTRVHWCISKSSRSTARDPDLAALHCEVCNSWRSWAVELT